MDALRQGLGRLTLALAAGLFATAASAAPALWKVTDSDSAIWLFGSIHILDNAVSWRTPDFDAALAEADQVYFELVLDDAGMAALGNLALEKGYLPIGQTLSAILSKDQNKRLDQAMLRLGMPRELIEPMQPWMAGLMISTFALQQSGEAGAASFAGGVESVLQAEIPNERERGLETPEEQLGFLSMGTPEEQAIALMQTVDQLDDANQAFVGATDAWLEGDVEAVHAEIVTSVGSIDSEPYKLLITDRNKRWVETLRTLLADNVEAMIIVGAAHLAGPVGVPTLLEEGGFSVERVD